MPDIFISYRREDSAGHTRSLADHLKMRFGQDSIFKDVDTINPGDDFEREIKQAVGSCKVLIAVIGRDWLSASDADGSRRLDKPTDYVRLEIATALARNIKVIPVLVERAPMPNQDALPEDLRKLATRNAIEFHDQSWESDFGRLAAILRKELGLKEPAPPRGPIRTVLTRYVAPIGVVVALIYYWLPLPNGKPEAGDGPSPVIENPQPPATKEPDRTGGPTDSPVKSLVRYPIKLPVSGEMKFPGAFGGEIVYTLLAAHLDQDSMGKLALKLSVRMTNNSPSSDVFSRDDFRLLLDNVPRAPIRGPNDLVDGHSAREGEVLFVVQDTATSATLEVRHRDKLNRVQIDLRPATDKTVSPAQKESRVAPSEDQPGMPKSNKLSGKINEELSSTQWGLQARNVTETAEYRDRFAQEKHVFRPQGTDDILLVFDMRVTNLIQKPQQPILTRMQSFNTGLVATDGHSYQPLHYDARRVEFDQAAPILPGAVSDFALIFSVPKGTKPKSLILTLNDEMEQFKGIKGTDFQISLER